jgi:protocatechuate 3,4-dioxygenase beta subunit
MPVSRVLIFLVAFAASAAAQAPARDTSARSAAGTGMIRGRVHEAGTERPLARVDIRLTSPVLPQPRAVKTDANGRYEVTGLPAGRYAVAASKANYLTTSFGATRAMGPGKAFDLADGQMADKVDFALPHAGVIAGKVVDEFGDPVPQAEVMTMRYQFVNGERRLVRAQGHAVTNDIGEFRAFGLPPGDYFVAGTLPDFVFNGSAISVAYSPTFYPGTANVGDAQRLTVGAGQVVSGVTLPLVAVQPTSVSGSVIDSRGRAVTTGFVNLLRQVAGMSVGGSGAPLGPDGTFTINGVTPGDFILRVSSGPDSESAAAPVSVNGTEVSGLQLVTAPPSVLRGRIVFEPGATPLKPSEVHLNANNLVPSISNVNVKVHEDLTFEIKLTAGHFLIRTPNPGPKWRLNRVLAAGADITDTGIDVASNSTISNIVVEMTHHVSELSGHVVDASGQPVRDCYVIVFAQDATRWTAQTRHVAVGRPAADETFHVLVPAGDYFVFATADVEPGEWTDAAYLARIRDRATAVSIRLDEKKTIAIGLAALAAR